MTKRFQIGLPPGAIVKKRNNSSKNQTIQKTILELSPDRIVVQRIVRQDVSELAVLADDGAHVGPVLGGVLAPGAAAVEVPRVLQVVAAVRRTVELWKLTTFNYNLFKSLDIRSFYRKHCCHQLQFCLSLKFFFWQSSRPSDILGTLERLEH